MSNFLNLHVLFTTPLANPNRDGSGAPKQMTYGGTTRSRISSQAMTRAKRVGYETSGSEDVSYRAKRGIITLALGYVDELPQQLTDEERALVEKEITHEVEALTKNHKKAAEAAQAKKTRAAKKGKGRQETTESLDIEDTATDAVVEAEDEGDGKKDTLVWLADTEIRKLATGAVNKVLTGGGDIAFIDSGNGNHGRTSSLAIAAFGRMFAQRPDLQHEAAIQRSAAFTCHAADVEADYFTAVNDLPGPESGKGAGHLAYNLLTSGVYYWHYNIDRDQLWQTWIPDADDTKNRERLTALFTALLLTLPSGKAATTAYASVPDAVLAVEATAPTSLHQAFEAPIQPDTTGGYRSGSLDALLDTANRLAAFTPRRYGQHRLATWTDHTQTPDRVHVDANLDALIDACVDWVLDGRPTKTAA